MGIKPKGKWTVWIMLALVLGALVGAPAGVAYAQDNGEEEEAVADMGDAVLAIGISLGIGITMAGTAYATAKSQQAVASAGFGAMAEKPELATWALILFAIPETIIVLGFVIAILMTGFY